MAAARNLRRTGRASCRVGPSAGGRLFQEGLAQLPQRVGLHLADALLGQAQIAADLLQGAGARLLVEAVAAHQDALLADAETFLSQYGELYHEAERAGVAVAVGGRALSEAVRGRMRYTTFGDRLTHLAAFARTLHRLPSRPRRGRPPEPNRS